MLGLVTGYGLVSLRVMVNLMGLSSLDGKILAKLYYAFSKRKIKREGLVMTSIVALRA